ncbi:type II toxin-antitoxin system RelE/ParE family toxin [Rhizobium gallicum]|uniref:type II toxin-antitoxin system RelE/ParE family toxin n=1 Tax=Rhizobium gallicum TaxID=56730 RepID=UPI001EF94C3A|nr:type II toxin-antitoxin system RelE/ParE family toxin [Rhizobium gallicum]ULJ75035.1 type II toxin-antitoxin system RelE/ParE family toxin [Rhizobium gallicum]
MDIVFAPAAAQDIEEIGDYIYAENPPTAIRFIMGLRSRCSRIADAPNGGAPRFSLSNSESLLSATPRRMTFRSIVSKRTPDAIYASASSRTVVLEVTRPRSTS